MSEASNDSLSALELFERHGAMVFRRCRQLLGSDDLAKDAVQEVFLRVLKKRDSFRGQSSSLTWVYSIATLHCLQQLRDGRRREDKLALTVPHEERAEHPALDERLSLSLLLREQDESVRLMVALRYLDGMTLEEVSEAVGISRKTVGIKLQRFLEDARTQLGSGAVS
jgi:RNA polymerase sigma-70 factor (ECF subfamily)